MVSETFWAALIGATFGGLATLAGGLVLHHLLARRREERRLVQSEQLKVHLDVATWWAGARPLFRSASADIATEVRGLDARGIDLVKQADEIAPLVREQVTTLLAVVPAELKARLYLYGGEQSYRQFDDATQRLHALLATANRTVFGDVRDGVAPRRLDATSEQVKEDMQQAAQLVRAHRVLDGAIQTMDVLRVTIAVDNRKLRRRARNGAKLQREGETLA
jgi:hypothetical protein